MANANCKARRELVSKVDACSREEGCFVNKLCFERPVAEIFQIINDSTAPGSGINNQVVISQAICIL